MNVVRLSCIAALAAAAVGCQSYSRPVEKPESLMSRDELNARGDELIGQGEDRRQVGMSRGSNIWRHAGQPPAFIIGEGERMIKDGRRLKAMAATRPAGS